MIEIRDLIGAKVERENIEFGEDALGERWWSGLRYGDRVYEDGALVFVAEDPAGEWERRREAEGER